MLSNRNEESESLIPLGPAPGPAPSEDAFVKYPPSWYLFCASFELKSTPFSKKILGREIVVFRNSQGNPLAMNGQCSHLGASLAGGCVVGDTIQCPYHGWKYGASGACVEVPGQREIPSFARQMAYPCVERNGFIFFFNGPKALFELPFFENEDSADYAAGGRFNFEAGCHWHLLAAHAFDQRHIEFVHDRKLLGRLEIDQPGPFSRRAQHVSLVCGETKFDRLIRIFMGKRVHISMTAHGGNMILVQGNFKSVKSRFFLLATPLEGGTTRIDGIIFVRKTGIALIDKVWAPINFMVRRWFTQGYLMNELRALRTHVYRPGALSSQDRTLIEYFQWVSRITNPRLTAIPSRSPSVPLEESP